MRAYSLIMPKKCEAATTNEEGDDQRRNGALQDELRLAEDDEEAVPNRLPHDRKGCRARLEARSKSTRSRPPATVARRTSIIASPCPSCDSRAARSNLT